MRHCADSPLLRRLRTAGLALIFAASALTTAQAEAPPALDERAALAAGEAAIGRTVPDYVLLDRQGREVKLSRYRGKPLLVSFIYTGCFQVCPATTRALHEAVKGLDKLLAPDQFNVVSIGFNQPFDSPSAMKTFATQNGIVFPNWEFLSPAPAIVGELTKAFGFSYAPTPAGFDHIVQVTLVDAEGKVYRQIYGETLGADQLVEPMKQLVTGAPVAQTGAVADLLDRVRILCSVYDPRTGEYRLSYALIFEIAGFLTFLSYIVWYLWKGLRRKNRPAI